MLRSNAELELSDLIRPLSLEALEYFASGVIPSAEGKSYQRPTSGKFIRIGGVMLIGTTMDYGLPGGGEDGERKFLLHINMLQHLRHNETELFATVRDLELDNHICKGVMSDAGSSFIRVDADEKPYELILGSNSYDFGRADEAGRAQTIEIAQQLVGPAVHVRAD